MPKKKKSFKEFETPKKSDGFVRLTNSLLYSKAYKSLKPYSIKLYIHMLQWAKGQDEVEYSMTLAE